MNSNLLIGSISLALAGAAAVVSATVQSYWSNTHATSAPMIEHHATATPTPALLPPPVHRGFWKTLQVNGDEVEGYASLDEMAEAADVVVIGTLSNFRLNRVIATSTPEYSIHFGAADLNITEVIRGGNPSDKLLLEFLLTGPQEHMQVIVRQQAETLPKAPALFFLRNKSGKEEGAYRIVNSLGLWVADERGVHAPLHPAHQEDDAPLVPRVYSQAQIERERAARPPGSYIRKSGALPSSMEPQYDVPHEPLRPYEQELRGVKTLADLASLLSEDE